MKQWKKKVTIMAAVGALAVTSLTGCGGSVDNDEAVATVGNDKVSYGVANFYARMQQAQYETYYAGMMGTTGEALWAQEIEEGKTYEDSVKESLLESLENLYLMKQHASEYEVILTEEDTKAIEKAAALFDEDNSLENKEAVSGYQKYVEEFLELATIQSKMQEPMRAGVDTEVSDEEAAQKSMKYVYFAYTKTDEEGNSSDMSEEEKEALKATAQEFVENLKASEAKDIDAAAAEAGVEVQTVTFDSESSSPNADLIAAADALENEGDVTDIVESDYGIYVGKVTSMLDRDATDKKKESIVEERKQEQYDSLLEKWREETEITENEKLWKKVKFKEQGVTIVESGDDYDE